MADNHVITPLRPNRQSTRRTFVCSQPDCRRSFGKAEHLRRHERGHVGDARYECPVCSKRFVRRDVMTRHAAAHGDVAALIKKPRKVSCVSCAASKVRCDGYPGTSCTRCVNSSHPCTYRVKRNTILSSHADNINSVDGVSDSLAAAGPDPTSELSYVEGNSCSFDRQPSAVGISVDESSLISTYPPLGDSIASNAPIPDIAGLGPLSLDSVYNLSIELPQTALGWDFAEDDFDLERTLNNVIHESPPSCWPLANLNTSSAPGETLETEQGALTTAATYQLIRDAQPADSPWPHVYKPSGDDSRLDLPQPKVQLKAQPKLHEAYLDHVDTCTREAILALISTVHQPQWPAVEISDFPSARTLSVYINLYFRHFHETLPILRRSEFRAAEINPVLLLSMAAIGAAYSRSGSNGLAVALNELARRAIAYFRENDRRTMFDTSIVQAWLLQSVFGLFCGSPMLYQHAEISRGGLVTAAKRMHLLRPNLSFVEELGRRRTHISAEELHRAYVKDEERRRLGWGIYLYDMQIACLLNIPSHFSVGEVDMPLPSEENVWNAQTVGQSVELEVAKYNNPNIRHVLEGLLSAGKLPQPLNPFGLSLIAHTLFCTDASSFDSILANPITANSSFYRLCFPSSFKHDPQELLDQLSTCLHFLSYTPNSLLVSVSALSHLAHIQFTWPGFLDKVKVAAGKSGSDESKRAARSWLSAKIADDPISARSLLLHAGQLSALITRFTFDTPSEAVWTFYAALSYWAILKLSNGEVISSTGPKRTVITWSDLDDVDSWVQEGGAASIQGLGNLADLSYSAILTIFNDRLESMSWGIAQKFRRVLMQLSNEL